MSKKLIAVELMQLSDQVILEKPDALGSVSFFVACGINSDDVIARGKSVLRFIDEHVDQHEWANVDYWSRRLPKWFVDSCAPEMTSVQAASWQKWWNALTEEERVEEEENRKWSLLNWVYWLEPERRNWYWWSARKFSEKSFKLDVLVNDWPFPWGSLKWLLKSAGAVSVNPE